MKGREKEQSAGWQERNIMEGKEADSRRRRRYSIRSRGGGGEGQG